MDPVFVRYLSGGEHPAAQALPYSLLPIGSIEFHGDHAPFGTDLTLAAGFARRLAIERPCLVFPAVPYTFVPSLTRRHGPGVSVQPTVLLPYLQQVLEGALAFGPDRLLVLNGHSENQYSLRLAAESVCEAVPGTSIAVVNWWRLAPDASPEVAEKWREGRGHGHGGPLEISVTAALDERGVHRPDDADDDVPYEAPWWRGAAQVVGLGQEAVGFRGYHGRISAIDADEGERLAREVTRQLVRFVDDWLQRAAS